MVSDVHLEGDSERQRAFVAWLDALEADELYLVGDVFHHWWGFRDGSVDGPHDAPSVAGRRTDLCRPEHVYHFTDLDVTNRALRDCRHSALDASTPEIRN